MVTQTVTSIEIGADDLPLHCLIAKTPAWNYHLRVLLDIASTGEAECSYYGIACKPTPDVELKGHH